MNASRILALTAAVAASLAVAATTFIPGAPVTAAAADATPTATSSATTAPAPTPVPDCKGAADIRTSRSVPFEVCGIPVISKSHKVTSSYIPALVTVKLPRSGISSVRLQQPAGDALTGLFKAAKKAGHTLVVRWAYRSYAWQKAAYSRDHVLTAPAGASEHQSGLAADLAAIKNHRLVRGYAFGSSAAGKWVAKHAAEYGFIIRYPSGQKPITGYSSEPWHLRWIGVNAANGVVATPTRTLERYLQIG